jgi:hypothetical protein
MDRAKAAWPVVVVFAVFAVLALVFDGLSGSITCEACVTLSNVYKCCCLLGGSPLALADDSGKNP